MFTTTDIAKQVKRTRQRVHVVIKQMGIKPMVVNKRIHLFDDKQLAEIKARFAA